ncbi:MAG: hypothetical protein A2Z97_05170 [Bdellovibrionales bacterium GWB1_52_6]|nr:MAG: hypothetical protein A2Z97_05170 [Bdellovibrionales bacterium GWB1_52_6]
MDFAVNKLKKAEVSEGFILQLQQLHIPEDRDRIIELNVLGGLATADYSGHYSKRALKRCADFIKKYRKDLKKAEKTFGISKEVIAALLWVETKHGKITGRYNVANVFFSLLQADHPEVIKSSLVAGAAKFPGRGEEYRQKIIERSLTKANWAKNELLSLDVVFRGKPGRLMMLSGSHSGAFGIPQFIPSSYVQWARTPSKTRKPDLFKINDVIQSVAFYLKANGWIHGDEAAQRTALFHYNRAQGYVDVILKIAAALQSQGKAGKSR